MKSGLAMKKIIPAKLLEDSFHERFKSFDYEIYHSMLSERELTGHGTVKGSALIVEVGRLSSFFMSQKIRKSLSLEDACLSAFFGWKLSYDFLSTNASSSVWYRQLDKISKYVFKVYKKDGVILSLADTSYLIFCCAMIREKLYSDFHYNMASFMVDVEDDENKIKVMYQIEEQSQAYNLKRKGINHVTLS